MSAYICEKETVVKVVDFIFVLASKEKSPVKVPAEYDTPVKLAKELNRANRVAVAYRYNEKPETAIRFAAKDFGARPGFIQGIKSSQCLCYQCEEGEVAESVKWLESLIASANFYAVEILGEDVYEREYRAATWG